MAWYVRAKLSLRQPGRNEHSSDHAPESDTQHDDVGQVPRLACHQNLIEVHPRGPDGDRAPALAPNTQSVRNSEGSAAARLANALAKMRSACFRGPMKRTCSLVASAALSVAISFAACSSSSGTSPGGDAGKGASTPFVPDFSCLQILQCLVDCPASDNTVCEDACGDKGTQEGQTNVLALLTCIDTEKCTEATCIQEKCAESLQTCLSSSAPKSTGTPFQGTAPPGSVPADLVGQWTGARDGITHRLTFNADGTGIWNSSITSRQSACFSFTQTTRTGSMVVDDKTITLYATSIVESVQECAPPARDTERTPTTEHLQWERADGDPNTILLIDNECAAKYPGQENCNIAGCPIGLYCTSRLQRE